MEKSKAFFHTRDTVNRFFVFLVLLLLSGCKRTSLPENVIKLQVDPKQPLQTVQTVSGGNFIHNTGLVNEPMDEIGFYNLDNLAMHHARVRITLEEWEPANDDADPLITNLDGFLDEGYNHNTFIFMQELQKRDITIIASIWNVPDWMVANPLKENERFIPYDLYPEVIESLTAWLKYAEEMYGVQISYVSFNEPDVGSFVSLIPQEYTAIIQTSAPIFKAAGLSTRWLLADTANIKSGPRFGASIWKEEAVRPFLGPFAVHSWDSEASDQELQNVADFAVQENLDVWITEGGWDPFLWTRPEEFPTWNNALQLARTYNRVLKLSRASVILYWQMAGKDYNTNDGSNPYGSFYVLRQLSEQIPTGSQIVWSSPNSDDLVFFAAKSSDHFIVHLVNLSNDPQQVFLEGLPLGKYSHISLTSGPIEDVLLTQRVWNGSLLISLLPESVNLVTTRFSFQYR